VTSVECRWWGIPRGALERVGQVHTQAWLGPFDAAKTTDAVDDKTRTLETKWDGVVTQHHPKGCDCKHECGTQKYRDG